MVGKDGPVLTIDANKSSNELKEDFECCERKIEQIYNSFKIWSTFHSQINVTFKNSTFVLRLCGFEQNMQVNDEESSQVLPDISSLSFADHVRVLNRIFALLPMSSVGKLSINEIIVSIQEVNERAAELNVPVKVFATKR